MKKGRDRGNNLAERTDTRSTGDRGEGVSGITSGPESSVPNEIKFKPAFEF